ncbi:MAG: sulfite exporter TauE/SafE family protein [Saprospiraceae bacterium]|uniref:Probable membrane transporter protein n=1 Tax=Candidatus Opimibacter skivensis TaxID=2982028 RepID=A0A9D7XPP3_9BACT|nr:sulfite exporter TauE/SafE family protein [Candidatus Opimibacter skivensis]
MHWSPEQIIIAFIGAFFAGFINALAGNGSVITLTVLTALLGLPGNIANGTNRIGVLMNSIGAMTGFAHKKVDYFLYVKYILPVVIGALGGIVVATQVTSDQFMHVFRFLMLLMLIVILVNPERWLIANPEKSMIPLWMEWPLFLILGFYGGFIQMGMGVFFLAVLVLVARLPMIEANAIKAVSVGIFTLIAVIIFAFAGQVVWSIGLIMGVAQFLGGWLSSHYASRIPGAAKFAYVILVIAVILSVVKLFW